jgi:hypothetical protein
MRLLLTLLMASAPIAARADDVSLPSVAAMVAGGQACGTKSLSDAKMAERLIGLGWEAKEARDPSKDMRVVRYVRNGVDLIYFTSKPMKQCIVTARTAIDFDQASLLNALTTVLGKPPKPETPGKRYLYFLPRLDILTVQFKSDTKGPFVEMSVVQ